MYPIYHELIKQGSQEWFDIRKGKLSASHACEIGNNGKGLDTYITSLMAEYYSSGEKEHFSNKHTDRGNELEEQARTIYELSNNFFVRQVGFVEYNEFVGASPDGLMETKGLEIKCPDDIGYFKILLNGAPEIDSKYLWQCQMNMLVCQRDEWDICFYNPNFEQSMTTFTIKRDEEKIKKLLQGFVIGEEKIKQIKAKLNN